MGKELSQGHNAFAVFNEHDEIVSMLHTTKERPGAVYIKILGTRKDYRRLGLMRALFKKMEAWHREKIFEVHTWECNTQELPNPAVRFYKSCGFSEASRKQDQYE